MEKIKTIGDCYMAASGKIGLETAIWRRVVREGISDREEIYDSGRLLSPEFQ